MSICRPFSPVFSKNLPANAWLHHTPHTHGALSLPLFSSSASSIKISIMATTTTLVLNGQTLTIEDLVHASRHPTTTNIHLSPKALQRMDANRKFALRVRDRNDIVYGLSVGVGIRKKTQIDMNHADRILELNRRIMQDTSTGQGPAEPDDVTRATAIVLLNTLAAGRTNVRPSVALHFAKRLNNGQTLLPLPMYGSTGIGDVVPLAHLASDLLGQMPVACGEALPLIGQSSLITSSACLAFHDCKILLNEMVVLAGLDIEAYAANPSPYHEMVATVRPYPGYIQASAILRDVLKGSALVRPKTKQRHLQAPLTYRGAAVVLGNAMDVFDYVETQLLINLNAHQQNPLALIEEDQMVPCANFDMQVIATALDMARIAIAPCFTAQSERSMKLLQKRDSGLTDGLEPHNNNSTGSSSSINESDSGESGHGFSGYGFTIQGMCSEARLLASPVSYEVGTSSQEEGVGDRLTMAGLAARRLREMTGLGYRIAAMSTVIAAQGIDVRGNKERLGQVGYQLHASIRGVIPTLMSGHPPPNAGALDVLKKKMENGMLAKVVSDTSGFGFSRL